MIVISLRFHFTAFGKNILSVFSRNDTVRFRTAWKLSLFAYGIFIYTVIADNGYKTYRMKYVKNAEENRINNNNSEEV